MTAAPRLVTADDMCEAAEAILVEHLPKMIQLLGWDTADGGLKTVRTWEQVPSLDALTSAVKPCGAITSGGVVDKPKRNGNGSFDVTWRLAVGVWDSGKSYRDTARRARRFAAAVRGTLLIHRSLGGFAESISWVSETYDERAQVGNARTLGGAVVGFDVVVKNVLDPGALADALANLTGPPVTSTDITVTHRTPEE